jgi:hypothetical protein
LDLDLAVGVDDLLSKAGGQEDAAAGLLALV